MPYVHEPTGAVPLWVPWSSLRRSSCTCSGGRCQPLIRPNELLQEGKYGMLVEKTEEGIANGLEKAIMEDDQLRKQTLDAQERARLFAPDVVLKQIEKILE